MDYKFNYQVPIMESASVDSNFIIKGTALNATITSTNHKFLSEELEKSAITLTGVPLLIDHKNEISAIKGRVIVGEYDEANTKINFRAHVIDPTMKQMIKDGRIDSVSVGATVESLEESDDGFFIPRGISFKELSLVAVPADANATFTVALQQAYETELAGNKAPKIEAKEDIHNQLNISGGKIMKSKDMKEQTKANETLNEDVKDVATEEATEDKTEEATKEETIDEKLVKAKDEAKQVELKTILANTAAAKLKLSDADEESKTEDKTEDKTEEEDEDEDDDDAEVEEKARLQLKEGYGTLGGGSITRVRI